MNKIFSSINCCKQISQLIMDYLYDSPIKEYKECHVFIALSVNSATVY